MEILGGILWFALGFMADIHNRELRRRRIKPLLLGYLPSFTESLALGNVGLSFYENYAPKKIVADLFFSFLICIFVPWKKKFGNPLRATRDITK